MDITNKSIIGDLVAHDYRTAAVFQSYGIDFCCSGNRSIDDAAQEKSLDVQVLVGSLNKAIAEAPKFQLDFNSWSLDLLSDYIEKKHHRYVETKLQEIKPLLEKVVTVHGERHPELIEIEQLFKESIGHLTGHMKKEELLLFPYIKKMVQAHESKQPLTRPRFGSIENPITAMVQEHDEDGDSYKRINELTNSYTPPADACNTYRVTYGLLKEFEEDLHLHIHLENNILFPKSIAMEKELELV